MHWHWHLVIQSKKLIRALDHSPGKLAKRALPIDHLVQIRLRKHRERIPGHSSAHALAHALDEMRHSAELALREDLQRLSGLEGQTVGGDIDLDDVSGARADIQPSLRIRVGDLPPGCVDEHGRRESGETTVIDVCSAPVVVVVVVVVVVCPREIMQQPRLGGQTRPHDSLQISVLIAMDIPASEPITRSGHQRCRVDNPPTQILHARPERDPVHLPLRPHIVRRVLRERLAR